MLGVISLFLSPGDVAVFAPRGRHAGKQPSKAWGRGCHRRSFLAGMIDHDGPAREWRHRAMMLSAGSLHAISAAGSYARYSIFHFQLGKMLYGLGGGLIDVRGKWLAVRKLAHRVPLQKVFLGSENRFDQDFYSDDQRIAPAVVVG